jgi:hypothetical protein
VIDQTLTLRLPPGLNTSSGLQAWWLSRPAAQQITGALVVHSNAPISYVVILPMSGGTADLSGYRCWCSAHQGAREGHALLTGDSYLFRERYAGASLNSPPVVVGIAQQRSVANAAGYLAAARMALLNAGAGREQEQIDREAAYQAKPTGTDVVRAFRFNQKVQSPDWEYVDLRGPTAASGPVTDGSTETVGEINFGGDSQLTTLTRSVSAALWPLHLNRTRRSMAS